VNQFEGYTKETLGGHRAMVRTARDAEAKPILCKGGKPRIFKTEVEAWRAVCESLTAYINGHLLRYGEVAGRAAEKAESLFPTLKSGRDKRRVEVTRKGGGRGRSG